MKFGLVAANMMDWSGSAAALRAVRAAEAVGFESIWTTEHVVFPDVYDSPYPYSPDGRMPYDRTMALPDPLVWLAHVAAVTTNIRLATGILVLPYRNPLVVAKQVATLDDLSGGRVDLGIGIGWLREEFSALGVPWERRGARTEEYVAVLRALWERDGASHAGEFVNFTDVSLNPKPRQSVRIIIGGHTVSAAERAGRIGDGFFPAMADPAEVGELVEVARRTAVENDRDPSSIEFTAVFADADAAEPVGLVESMAAVGVTRLVVPAFAFMTDDVEARLDEFAQRVIVPTAALGAR
jgi:probable F420-dependent oxidoreductase